MTSPNFDSILAVYQQALGAGVLEYFQRQSGLKIRRGIYSARVVLWLMIVQRLNEVGTLAAAVQLLIQGVARPLLENCRRVRTQRISARPGGYCQARHHLPALLCRQVSRAITERLRNLLKPVDPEPTRVYVLDGSSVELEHSPALVKGYPPSRNQFAVSHWPVVRMVVLHELATGLAEEPQWGPMYGDQAVSEQALTGPALDRLPAAAAVLGDRNFGVLWVAHEAQKRGLSVVLRLTKPRAWKLSGGPITSEGEAAVSWQAGRWDGGKQRCLPVGTTVNGRLIAVRVGRGQSKQWLYLFTTLNWPAEKIVALYGQRWTIETDLRSLKRTVRIHHLTVKSTDMLEKELLMSVAAYNLVRTVMALAARKTGTDPRQLSFAQVLNVVDCAWPKLAAATTPAQFEEEFSKVLDLAAQCTLPKRKNRRSYPRKLWRRNPGFQFREGTKTK